MIKNLIVILVILMMCSTVKGFTVRERFGDDAIFTPSDTNTNYTINPDMELDELIISDNCLYINGNMFKFTSTNGSFVYAHLGSLILPQRQLVVTETTDETYGCLGGYEPSYVYLVYVSESDFLTVTANETGFVEFTWMCDGTVDFILVALRCDVNLDEMVDVIDISLVWSNRVGKEPYHKIFDVNDDQHIGVIDLSFIWSVIING